MVRVIQNIIAEECPSHSIQSPTQKKIRGSHRVNDIRKHIHRGMSRYLDIGSMDGSITMSISSYLIWLRDNTTTPGVRDVRVSSVGLDCNPTLVSHSSTILTHPFESSFDYSNNTTDVVSKLQTNMYGSNTLDFVLYDGTSIPFPKQSFDIITSFMTLHHVENLSEHVREIHRVLEVGGKWIVREHHVSSDEMKHAIEFLHECYDSGYNTSMPIHTYYTRNQWIDMCISFGFRVEFATHPKKCVARWVTSGRKRFVMNPYNSFYMVLRKV